MISVAFVVVAHDGNWKKIRGLEMKYVTVIVTPVKFGKYALNDRFFAAALKRQTVLKQVYFVCWFSGNRLFYQSVLCDCLVLADAGKSLEH